MSTQANKISRRAMLAGLGLTGALPWLPVLDAQAQDGDVPQRLILMFHPFGTLRDKWWPQVSGPTDFTFANRPISQSLEAIKEHLVLFDGVKMKWRSGAASHNGKSYSTGDQHQKGMGALWTGSRLLQHWETTSTSGIGGQDGVIGRASGISVDQFIANELQPDTPFQSLQLGVDVKDASEARTRMIYSGSDAPLNPIEDPVVAWETIFAPFSGDVANLEKIRQDKSSVFDLVSDQLGRVEQKLGADDVARVQAHLTAVDSLKDRLASTVSCGDVPVPNTPDVPFNHALPEFARMQIDLMVQAMACDLTRFASLQIKDEAGGNYGWLGDGQGSFHNLSHSGGSGPIIQEAYTDFNELFVYLIEALAAVPEGDGTMLDNTVVCWGSALRHGDHNPHPIPFVLAGGGNKTFQTGRVLEFDEIDHQRLLVSLCHAMGCNAVDSFGNLDEGSGPVPGLFV